MCLTLIIYHALYLIFLDILYKNVLYNVGIPTVLHLTLRIFCCKFYNPKDHQLRLWILNCFASCARRHFELLTAGSDRASLSDLTNFYLCLCIGLPYTLQLIIRASLIKYFYFFVYRTSLI